MISKEKLLYIASNPNLKITQFENFENFTSKGKKQKQLGRLNQCSSHSNRNHSRSRRFKDG